MSAADRGLVTSLITHVGLSQKEAAEIMGIGHEALSRKLAGKPRYDFQQGEIEALSKFAARMDQIVADAIAQLHAAIANEPTKDFTDQEMYPIRLLMYRSDEDLPPWTTKLFRFASAHRSALTRVLYDKVVAMRSCAILFDRESYNAFLDGRKDSQEMREDWAVLQKSAPRFGFKLTSKAIGWAAIGDPAANRVVERKKPAAS